MSESNGGGVRYVYGVVRARRSSRLKQTGINGEPLKVVADGGLGALTSTVPEGFLEAGRDEFLTHSAVLERALKKGTVLPMQFGVVMPDEAAIRRDLLKAHRQELEVQLEEMDGKVEVNVKGIYSEPRILREALDENAELRGITESARYKHEDDNLCQSIEIG